MALTKDEIKWATVMALTTPPRGTPKPPKPPAYLTFHSDDGEFTLRVYDYTKHWDGTLEWSTDTTTWTEWDGTTTLSSGGGYLYLRGTGNSVITGNSFYYRWALTGNRIDCIGNIENLLDYSLVSAGLHPSMADYCYRYMFYGCRSLTTAPELPATTLSDSCYISMFDGCWSLTTAPELPATTLSSACYEGMFYGCTSLTTVPELPATTLTDFCYYSMFAECSSLHISSVSSSTYPYSYRIPTSGTGTMVSNALTRMFNNTGGPFNGTPEINTTYYTDHAPV